MTGIKKLNIYASEPILDCSEYIQYTGNNALRDMVLIKMPVAGSIGTRSSLI